MDPAIQHLAPLKPLISIIMAARAPSPWLSQALASVKQQTYGNWELVCVADGHNDDIRHSVGELGSRAQYLTLPRGNGAANCRNLALSRVAGELVAVIDSDDVWHPEHLSQHAECFAQHPNLVLRGTRAQIVNDTGALQPKAIRVPTMGLRYWLLLRNVFVHSSVMFRRTAATSVGGYNPALTIGEDLDLWLRMATLGCLDNGAAEMVRYRRHSNQTTQTRSDLEGAYLILQSRLALGKHLHISPAVIRSLHSRSLKQVRCR